MSKEMREQMNKFNNLLNENIDNTENEMPSTYQAFLFPKITLIIIIYKP